MSTRPGQDHAEQNAGLALEVASRAYGLVTGNVPTLLLMDEPTVFLDPAHVGHRDLMGELSDQLTIVFATDNAQQAARVAGEVGFLAVDPRLGGGVLVEFGTAQRIFTRPADARTHDYIARHHD